MTLLIYNLIFAMFNILLLQYSQYNQSVGDPNESLKEINEIIDNTEDGKPKDIIVNIVEMTLNNPEKVELIIYLLFFVPIINVILLGVNITNTIKDSK